MSDTPTPETPNHAEAKVLVDIFEIVTGGISEKVVKQSVVLPSKTVGTLRNFPQITVVLMEYDDHTAYVRFREGGVDGRDFLTIHVSMSRSGKDLAFWLSERTASGANWLLWMKVYNKIFGSRSVRQRIELFEEEEGHILSRKKKGGGHLQSVPTPIPTPTPTALPVCSSADNTAITTP